MQFLGVVHIENAQFTIAWTPPRLATGSYNWSSYFPLEFFPPTLPHLHFVIKSLLAEESLFFLIPFQTTEFDQSPF